MSRFIDLTGQTFGRLTVLYKAPIKEKKKQAEWVCQCECGNKIIVGSYQLRHGLSAKCAICRASEVQDRLLVDITGKRFGKLVPQYYIKDKKKWHCKCDCGNEVDVSAHALKSGNTKGCMRCRDGNRFVDKTGMVFNHLTVISKFGMNRHGKTLWLCKCDCGNEHIVATDKLSITQSCGHLSTNFDGSSKENEIKNFVKVIFDDVDIEKAKILDGKEIDIYLPEYKFGIEYNGSAFHATENGAFSDKDKYYHRDKFLLAREKGIHLITVFDIDYETNKLDIFNNISNILLNSNYEPFIPKDEVVYTNNDYDNGLWLLKYGYKEVGQEEPAYFIYNNKYKVYRCGRTIWRK